MPEWKTMETAPLDGTPILVIGGWAVNNNGSWQVLTATKVSYSWKHWLVCDTYHSEVEVDAPELWTPLPAPPVTPTEGEH